MKPWQPGDTPVLPDAAADQVIAEGNAVAYEPMAGDIVFPPDVPAVRPVKSYLTRGAARR